MSDESSKDAAANKDEISPKSAIAEENTAQVLGRILLSSPYQIMLTVPYQ